MPWKKANPALCKEYMALPESACANSTLLKDYLKRSYDYTLTLPEKKVKAKRHK